MKAWAITVRLNRQFDHIAFGETAAKVRHKSVVASRDAGFDFTYADIKVKRAPWCDTTPEQDAARKDKQ